MPNVPLLRQVLGHVEAHPELHNQEAFALRSECGTTHCFAGWTVALAAPEAEFEWTPIYQILDGTSPIGANQVRMPDGVKLHIATLAADLLGLDVNEADRLFYVAETLEDCRRIVGELCDGVPA